MAIMSGMDAKPAYSVAEVMEECQHWLSRIIDEIFYGAGGALPEASLPALYTDWLNDPHTQKIIHRDLLATVRASGDSLKTALIDAYEHPPQRANFSGFMQAFEDFMARLNRIENDSLLSGHGIDSLTGFKTGSVLVPELKRELDRRARRGNPFSVAMLRLDAVNTEEELDFRLKLMAKALRQCLRSFDDVYRLEAMDLIVGLKHSDLKGGMRFVERLKVEMKNLNVDFTFSSCIAEPDPADDINEFLKNLEKDLTLVAANGSGQSIRYEELSPLQRFVSNMKDGK
jgi:diguanylate cyclase